MATVVNINDVLDGHVALEVECVDRLYLNVYVPKLQVGGQVVRFLAGHLGNPIPSPAVIEQIGNRFRREVKAFAAANQIPVLRLKKPDRSRWDDRKVDHVRPYLDQAERDGRFGVVAIVAAQEFQWVFSGRNRSTDAGRRCGFEFTEAERRVGIYYFYVLDPDFGPGFIKICTYFPYPAKVWLNGHEWAKRQADRAGIGYTALANGFATCDDPDAAAGDLRPVRARRRAGVLRPVDRRRSRPRSPRPTAPPATGGSCRCARSRCHAPWCFDDPRRARGVLRSARRRQHRHRPPRRGPRRVRPPTAGADHRPAVPHPDLHARHRSEDRLPLQAQPGQAIPQGRQGAADRDRHQQAIRHRRPAPASSTCPS